MEPCQLQWILRGVEEMGAAWAVRGAKSLRARRELILQGDAHQFFQPLCAPHGKRDGVVRTGAQIVDVPMPVLAQTEMTADSGAQVGHR